jgi:TatD DNase family protein
LEFVRQNASSEKVFAIGECGLDKIINVPLEEQKRIFVEQIKIAEQNKKPLIIHCVKAFDELIKIKNELQIKVPIVIHGFNNNGKIAQQLLKSGFYISLGKALMQDDSNAQKLITQINPEKLFLETDDGNYSIKSIFDKASKLLNIDVEALKKQIMLNFKKLLNNG